MENKLSLEEHLELQTLISILDDSLRFSKLKREENELLRKLIKRYEELTQKFINNYRLQP